MVVGCCGVRGGQCAGVTSKGDHLRNWCLTGSITFLNSALYPTHFLQHCPDPDFSSIGYSFIAFGGLSDAEQSNF